MPKEPLDTPLDIVAAEGQVLIEGSLGIAFAMTAKAALETSELFHTMALRAIGQEKHREWKIGDPPPRY